MVKIGHAVSDENGKARGGLPGDQTDREIRVQDWYNRDGGWGCYLECTDRVMADKAASFMEQICADPAFGYSQDARWDGYKSIRANGGKVAGASGDFDCSTLCLACYILAGLKHKAAGSTHTMQDSLLATGKFVVYTDDEHIASTDYARRGGLYLRRRKHVAMVLSDGPKAALTATDSKADPPYVEILGSVHVRSGPSKQYESLFIARKGQRYAFGEEDADTGWYGIEYPGGMGFVSNKPVLTRLVKE